MCTIWPELPVKGKIKYRILTCVPIFRTRHLPFPITSWFSKFCTKKIHLTAKMSDLTTMEHLGINCNVDYEAVLLIRDATCKMATPSDTLQLQSSTNGFQFTEARLLHKIAIILHQSPIV